MFYAAANYESYVLRVEASLAHLQVYELHTECKPICKCLCTSIGIMSLNLALYFMQNERRCSEMHEKLNMFY